MTKFNNKDGFNLASHVNCTTFCDADNLADSIADLYWFSGQAQVPIEEGLTAAKKVIQKELFLCNKQWYSLSPIEKYYMLKRHVESDLHYVMNQHIVAVIDKWIDYGREK